MGKSVIKKILVLIAVCIFAGSSSDSSDSPISQGKSVIIAGGYFPDNGSALAAYWADGVYHELPLPVNAARLGNFVMHITE